MLHNGNATVNTVIYLLRFCLANANNSNYVFEKKVVTAACLCIAELCRPTDYQNDFFAVKSKKAVSSNYFTSEYSYVLPFGFAEQNYITQLHEGDNQSTINRCMSDTIN